MQAARLERRLPGKVPTGRLAEESHPSDDEVPETTIKEGI